MRRDADTRSASTSSSRRRVLAHVGSIVGGAAVGGRPGGDTRSAAHGGPDRPPLVAHRGCAATRPENTIAAVEAAAALVDWVEVDVRRCGTGELVAFHDATLGRVTNASGRVDETTLETLSQLSVERSGEPVPTLEAVFEATPTDTALLLDLKEPGLVADVRRAHATHGHELRLVSDAETTVEEAQAASTPASVAYAVREPRSTRLLRPVVPGLPAWLYPSPDVDEMVATARRLGCVVISPRYELCLGTSLVTRAHDAGLRVWPWTVRSRRAYAALAAADVDAVIADRCVGVRG